MDMISKWIDYYKDTGISDDLLDQYIEYAKPLLLRKLPVIFELSHLSLLLGRDELHLLSMINATERHYRTFSIKKRQGGKRDICAPYPSLLGCQRWVLDNILYPLKIHDSPM